MPRPGIAVAGVLIVLLGGVGACAANGLPQPRPAASASRAAASMAPTAAGSPDHPIGMLALGQSWMTGFMSDPQNPWHDTAANSWATGTNPDVHSIYQRLVEARPETAGHVANTAKDGATSDLLPGQAMDGLTQVPYPALVVVQIVGNDVRCDGSDPRHYPEFRANVRSAVQTVLKVSPHAVIVLIADPGRPATYARTIATLPTTPPDYLGTGPCAFFSANRTINRAGVARVTGLLAAYEDEQTKVCRAIPQCHTDAGAATRIELPISGYGKDLSHPSVSGHARIAAAEWPVVASVLGLG